MTNDTLPLTTSKKATLSGLMPPISDKNMASKHFLHDDTVHSQLLRNMVSPPLNYDFPLLGLSSIPSLTKISLLPTDLLPPFLKKQLIPHLPPSSSTTLPTMKSTT